MLLVTCAFHLVAAETGHSPSQQGHSLLVAVCVCDLPVCSSLPFIAGLSPAYGHYLGVPSGQGTSPSPFPVGTLIQWVGLGLHTSPHLYTCILVAQEPKKG